MGCDSIQSGRYELEPIGSSANSPILLVSPFRFTFQLDNIRSLSVEATEAPKSSINTICILPALLHAARRPLTNLGRVDLVSPFPPSLNTMSYHYPPLEDHRFSYYPFTKADLVSLCLVSKRALAFAQPLLYHHVYLTVGAPWFRERTYTGIFGGWHLLHDSFFRSISLNPSLARHLKSLGLSMNAVIFQDQTSHDFKEVLHLLRASVNLRHLRFSCPIDSSTRFPIPDPILHAVTPRLHSLDFYMPRIDQDCPISYPVRLYSAESSYPHTKTPSASIASLSFSPTPRLETRTRLEIASYMTFDKVLRILAHLKDNRTIIDEIKVPFSALQLVPGLKLDMVTSLEVYREYESDYTGGFKTGDTDYSEILISIIKACSSVRTLKVSLSSWSTSAAERFPAFGALPRSLETLFLICERLDSDQLVHFLTTTNLTLGQLEISRILSDVPLGGAPVVGTMFREKRGEEIEEACDRKGISLRWEGVGTEEGQRQWTVGEERRRCMMHDHKSEALYCFGECSWMRER